MRALLMLLLLAGCNADGSANAAQIMGGIGSGLVCALGVTGKMTLVQQAGGDDNRAGAVQFLSDQACLAALAAVLVRPK